MDTFEFAKIAGAVLCALLVIVGSRTALQIIEENRPPQKPGYTLPMPEVAAQGKEQPGVGEAVPPPVSLPAVPEGDLLAGFDPAEAVQLTAGADVANGKTIFRKCVACHSSEEGGPNNVGPNLWGIVDRAKASHDGFTYSEALKAKGGDWSLVALASFLHNPKEYAPGTKMIFPGISNVSDVADLLAYLNTLGGSAAP
ncbi:MAG: c-type cytochrome [Hyphomicrobium sp.]